MKNILIISLCCAVLTACGGSPKESAATGGNRSTFTNTGTVGVYKVGNPYRVNGLRYVPMEDPNYDQTGIASWYGPNFNGRRTANGEVFDMDQISAAHTTLPMPSMVKVTNLENGRSLIVRVNDRGPFVDNRIIDMSKQAARELGFLQQGTARVRVQYHGPAVGAAAKPVVAKTDLMPLDDLPPLPEESQQVASSPPAPQYSPQPAPAKPASAFLTSSAFAAPVQETTLSPIDANLIHIQMGAFASADNAARLMDQVSAVHAAFVHPAMVNDHQYYRVRLGPFASVAEAEQVHNRLKEAGFSGARITVE